MNAFRLLRTVTNTRLRLAACKTCRIRLMVKKLVRTGFGMGCPRNVSNPNPLVQARWCYVRPWNKVIHANQSCISVTTTGRMEIWPGARYGKGKFCGNLSVTYMSTNHDAVLWFVSAHVAEWTRAWKAPGKPWKMDRTEQTPVFISTSKCRSK